MADICLKPVSELLDMNFFIPNYQRGYRWNSEQVTDLMNDIFDFYLKVKEGKTAFNEFYCIQPLVVKSRGEEETKKNIQEAINQNKSLSDIQKCLKGIWDVIDGQQRLTTICIILSFFNDGKIPYSIKYETRKDSEEYLKKISSEDKDKGTNIDFYYMKEAYKTVKKWSPSRNKFTNKLKEDFIKTLLNQVKFIWYEIDENEDPIKVFTRLNIGKIPLTNSELIKALFFNNRNQTDKTQKKEIAMQWNQIENFLQDDKVWYFLFEQSSINTTRIDVIFNSIKQLNLLNLKTDNDENDVYSVYKYFDNYFENEGADLTEAWKKVLKIYRTIEEWYNNDEVYHYVGFLIASSKDYSLNTLLKPWFEGDKTNDGFCKYLKEKIIDILNESKDKNQNTKILEQIYEKEYEYDSGKKFFFSKTRCKPILLLHNIQTIIDKNTQYLNSNKFELPSFERFPFHLYKKEKWDIEHIDSATENELENIKDKIEWLQYCLYEDDINGELRTEIQDKIKSLKESDKNNGNQDDSFNELRKKISDELVHDSENSNDSTSNPYLNGEEKNQIWNYTLLDSNTNRSYHNAIFAAKRRTIIGKEQNICFKIDDDYEIKEDKDKKPITSFILPVTKNVFLKYYSPHVKNFREWTKYDAENYKENIATTLQEFLSVVDRNDKKVGK